MKSGCWAFLLVAMLAVSAAQARQAPLVERERIELRKLDGSVATVAQVRAAIIAAARPLGWTVGSDEPGALRLSYNKQNKHFVTIRADYDAGGYQLRYVESTNLNYEVIDGVPQIHPNYNRWINNLVSRIQILDFGAAPVAASPTPASTLEAATR